MKDTIIKVGEVYEKKVMIGGLTALLMTGNIGAYGLDNGVVFGQAPYEAPRRRC